MGYQVSQNMDGKSGGGPRVNFGTDTNADEYFSVGAYDNINNLDTMNRPLKIFSSTNKNPITVIVLNLPNASSAPSGADLEAVVIDKATGRLYIQ